MLQYSVSRTRLNAILVFKSLRSHLHRWKPGFYPATFKLGWRDYGRNTFNPSWQQDQPIEPYN